MVFVLHGVVIAVFAVSLVRRYAREFVSAVTDY